MPLDLAFAPMAHNKKVGYITQITWKEIFPQDAIND